MIEIEQLQAELPIQTVAYDLAALEVGLVVVNAINSWCTPGAGPLAKKRGRLENIITHLLGQIPYKAPGPLDVTMPKPPSHGGYSEPESSRPNIPTPF